MPSVTTLTDALANRLLLCRKKIDNDHEFSKCF